MESIINLACFTYRSWYKPDAILRNNSLANALVNKLYDLNDVDFDLSSSGHDLDISWPAFSRLLFKTLYYNFHYNSNFILIILFRLVVRKFACKVKQANRIV